MNMSSKFFSLQRNLLSNQMKFFSTIRLTLRGNTLKSFDNQVANTNWELSKNWVNPLNSVHINSLSASSSGATSSQPKIVEHKQLGNVKFTQFYRKMGKIISQADNVYVQTGKIGDLKVKIISSEKDSIEGVSSILDSKANDSEVNVSILYLTKGELDVNPFIITSAEEKVVLSNSKNYEAVKNSVLKLIENK